MKQSTRIAVDWILPLFLLAAATIAIRVTGADLALERAFYRGGWYLADRQPWSALYHYGVIPAWVLAGGALALLVASRWKPRLAAHRRTFVYLVLVMAVGPGLVVNTAFKEHWGRPRPMDVPEFGGRYEFVPVWNKGEPDRGQSFPSGHASTGFYFVALYFVLRDRPRRLRAALAWLAFALAFGAIIGMARMIQGKHFLSDVVWSAGFVWLTAVSFYYALGIKHLAATGDRGGETTG